jgi:hypothetical protein
LLLAAVLQVKGRKPEWEVGAQQAIKRKKAAAVPQAPAASIWSSINIDDADLLDDDELLTEEDLVRPVPQGLQRWLGAAACCMRNWSHTCMQSVAHAEAKLRWAAWLGSTKRSGSHAATG